MEWRVEMAAEFREQATQYLYFATREEALPVYRQALEALQRVKEGKNAEALVTEFVDGYGGVLAVETRRIGTVRLVNAGEFHRHNVSNDLQHRKAVAELGLTLAGDRLQPR